MGSGQDFNLRLYHSEQPDQEYELDQDVIPRSSYVLAKRSPAFVKLGKYNNALRYITGKPRINRKAITSTVGHKFKFKSFSVSTTSTTTTTTAIG